MLSLSALEEACVCSVDLACGSTLASKSSIFRSKAVSWLSIAAAVLSPLSKKRKICVSLRVDADVAATGLAYWLCGGRYGIRDAGSKMVKRRMPYFARSLNAYDARIRLSEHFSDDR